MWQQHANQSDRPIASVFNPSRHRGGQHANVLRTLMQPPMSRKRQTSRASPHRVRRCKRTIRRRRINRVRRTKTVRTGGHPNQPAPRISHHPSPPASSSSLATVAPATTASMTIRSRTIRSTSHRFSRTSRSRIKHRRIRPCRVTHSGRRHQPNTIIPARPKQAKRRRKSPIPNQISSKSTHQPTSLSQREPATKAKEQKFASCSG